MHKPERLLHTGHGKTGSSFLQSALALSSDALRDASIAYPIDPEIAARARAGGITAGNFRPAPRLLLPDTRIEVLLFIRDPGTHRNIVSARLNSKRWLMRSAPRWRHAPRLKNATHPFHLKRQDA